MSQRERGQTRQGAGNSFMQLNRSRLVSTNCHQTPKNVSPYAILHILDLLYYNLIWCWSWPPPGEDWKMRKKKQSPVSANFQLIHLTTTLSRIRKRIIRRSKNSTACWLNYIHINRSTEVDTGYNLPQQQQQQHSYYISIEIRSQHDDLLEWITLKYFPTTIHVHKSLRVRPVKCWLLVQRTATPLDSTATPMRTRPVQSPAVRRI